MNWQEAEQLAECIKKEAPQPLVVLGIEPFGPGNYPSYGSDYFVNCVCQISGLRFAVKSFKHWEDLKQHVIFRICNSVYRLLKR